MEKPFDVSVEQLAHDLALITTARFMSTKPGNSQKDCYDDYINEYRIFKELIQKEL